MVKNKFNGITLEELAQMVAKGFENTVTKEQFELLRYDISEIKEDIADIKKRLSKLEARVDNLYELFASFEEGIILDLQRRVATLERTVKTMSKRAQ